LCTALIHQLSTSGGISATFGRIAKTQQFVRGGRYGKACLAWAVRDAVQQPNGEDASTIRMN
jgi:hypothetical protein